MNIGSALLFLQARVISYGNSEVTEAQNIVGDCMLHLALLTPTPTCAPLLELATKVREDFTITETAPTRAFSWLKVQHSTFTLLSKPALTIFAFVSKFHLLLSANRQFQPGEGPSRGLLRDCEIFAN